MSSRETILRLSPDCSPKLLEEPCVYNRATDDLYIVNPEAADFLFLCARGAKAPRAPEADEFVSFCQEEGILEETAGEDALIPHLPAPGNREPRLTQSPIPSLRYLLLHITDRCNLRCGHCFIGEPGSTDLPLEKIMAVVDQFEEMQGLRLLVSGGEPLLHRQFRQLDDYLAARDLRTVLMSNGTLIDKKTAGVIKAQEVQISLDGMREAHDFIRGDGNFERSTQAIRRLIDAGKQVSVATMVHRGNLQDFEELAALLSELGVREWAVDQPSPAGRLLPEADRLRGSEGGNAPAGSDSPQGTNIIVYPAIAGPYLNYSFGGAIHEPIPGYACGAHLMAVMADGRAARCGFFAGNPVGTIAEGLSSCWQKVRKMTMPELDCDCDFIEDCRGGCRFRAAGYNSPTGVDPCQCYRYGVAT